MYIVVSYWSAESGKEKEFEEQSLKVKKTLLEQPGVAFIYTFKSGGSYVAVHGYDSESVYNQLVNDPKGVFAQSMEENKLDAVGHWVKSDRGEDIV
ncbi:MAG: hypothetical protein A2666_03420 [Parcubacteria group bacterium RIFCSPHIGHO2_01_FULL_47_10b]|nr:MAG: hypothetical protein A2666_03420 [Parcubacteria group bacterium RIFCSPHIGHO2_01_FULL_47_10b]